MNDQNSMNRPPFRESGEAQQAPVPPQTQPPFYPDSYFIPTQRPKPSYRALDALFAWLSILVGFLFVRVMPVTRTPLGAILFLVLLYAFGGIYLHLSGLRLSAPTVLFAVSAALLSVGMITNGNRTIRGFLFLFLLLAFLYWCYAVCGLAGKHPFRERLTAYLCHAIFVVPFTSLEHLFPALVAYRRENEKSKKNLRTLGWILLGLAIAVIPTSIVVALLSYDSQFTDLLSRIFSFSIDGAWEFIRDLILGFLCAILLFGFLFGVLWRRQKNNGETEELKSANLHVLPRALLCTAVTPILAVYVIFFVSQWSYYVSAFTHVLPREMTYAAYAREGFFQLCGVCALNAVMLLLFNLLIKRTEKKRDLLQILYSSVISVFTLILIATAISKMALYIDSYGLTQKRVYASWLMLLLAVIFVLVLIRQVTAKLKLIPSIALCCVIFFALITLPNVDGMIANYNVDAYLAGELNEVDVNSLADYGSSSVPALVRLKADLSSRQDRDEKTENILKNTDLMLDIIFYNLDDDENTFFSFNIPDAKARDLLK